MPDDYWFKPKTHGYGATPANWKGWAATIVVIDFLFGITLLLIGVPGGSSKPDFGSVIGWAVMVAAVVGAYVLLVKSKTEGEWKWRWGEDEKK